MSNNTQDSDVEFIKALSDLICDNDLAEIRVKRHYPDESSINVCVTRKAAMAAVAAAPMAMAAPAAPAATAPVETASTGDPAALPGAVTSPMVGTVYLAPEPDAAPFVSVGTVVTEGQTLLIVEAMKTMNQIPAPKAGTVKRIMVEDGSAVEFGSPLVVVE